MKKYLSMILLGIMAACTAPTSHESQEVSTEEATPKTSIKIAFGSCSNQNKPQPLWDDILAESPDVWIWLGDNIYGDTDNMDTMRAKYQKQKMNPGYQALRAATTVIGTWDDHDFGKNNAGKEYEAKVGSQQELLDFLDVPVDDVRRTREGVYGTYTLGDSAMQVKVLLLDTRYFRDEMSLVNDTIVPNPEGAILGEAQWAWLENELAQSTADVHLFASGIQFLPEEHIFEKWANFPQDRTKMLEMLVKYEVKKPIFLTGDRHIGEMSKLDYNGRKVYDITSSSLTHGWSDERQEPNRHREGDIVYALNYGLIEINADDSVRGYLKSDSSAVMEKLDIVFE
ncbi:alkaline phosphatase D [Reichenbachiella agariperforans]|uniref:Alkaline phosphatase D n=1 Tax=Reichenbachiella agariperforans TaxID=156994 RepID=A0A1M6L8F3_REIAG|nr:alkaline phosphatase D family protein [Reichenbachiella agariperforans]SHJ67538.1 alkaline phosphatase D [Reichenbachiella agariperforans]